MPDRILLANGQPIPADEAQRKVINRLLEKLEKRQPDLRRLDDYYRGKQPLRFAGEKFRDAFGGAFRAFSDNFLALVVEAEEERLNIEGFRIGTPPPPEELADRRGNEPGPPADGEPAPPARPPVAPRRRPRSMVEDVDLRQADADARQIWQENELDAESSVAHIEALVKGLSYLLIWPRDNDDGKRTTPRITVEDPLEMVHESEPGSPQRVTLAAKTWRTEDGYQHLTVYYPDRAEKWSSDQKVTEGTGLKGRRWVRRAGVIFEPSDEDEGELEEWPLPHDFGRVPIVLLRNRPRLGGSFRSEIEDLMSAQDAINKLAADLLVSAEFAAFRQRWATGIEIPEMPEGGDQATGREIEPYKAAVNRVWLAESEKARFGDFEVSDLRPYVAAIELWVQHIATRSRTPAHYLLGQSGSFPSGESLQATETGLVAKSRRAMRWYGEAWEETMRLAFLAWKGKGDPRATAYDSETIWSNPEQRSEAEHTDAVLKLKGLNLPDEFLWELYGLSQNQIARLIAMREREADSVGDAFERAITRTTPLAPPVTIDQAPAPGQPTSVPPPEPVPIAPPRARREPAVG